jgi:hypothetical protein
MNNPQLSRKEETLSDKIVYASTNCDGTGGWGDEALRARDVKEFIKKLKEEIKRLQNKYDVVPMNYVFDSLDELAGDKLI